jgi:hypothetical protein
MNLDFGAEVYERDISLRRSQQILHLDNYTTTFYPSGTIFGTGAALTMSHTRMQDLSGTLHWICWVSHTSGLIIRKAMLSTSRLTSRCVDIVSCVARV